MKPESNPAIVGGFVAGAIALLVTALLVFGRGELTKPKAYFVIDFDSSLNGLNVGAPVKIQGVAVGTVKDISLQYDPKSGRIVKPVLIEVDPTRLRDLKGAPLSLSGGGHARAALINRWIDQGLRARLELQSLLTGLLYIELNFFPDKPARMSGLSYDNVAELPSIPTSVDEIRAAVEDFVVTFRRLPLEQIINDMAQSMEEIKNALTSQEAQDSRKNLAAAIRQMEDLLRSLSKNLDPVAGEVQGTLVETRKVLRSLDHNLSRTLTAATQSLNAAETAMATTNITLKTLGDTVGPDSTLDQALLEIRNASRNIRTLTDYLERNPSAVIYGKP